MYPTYVLNSCRQYQEISDFYLAETWPQYMSICIVLYVCDIYVLYCFFLFFFSLMIGKTFVMLGYANKEFEFEFEKIELKFVSASTIRIGWPTFF